MSATLKSVYFACFLSIMKHGITFWENSPNSKKIFILQKKTVRLMAYVKPRNSCRSIFKKSEILALPYLHIFNIFSLMNFIVNNQEHFQTNSAIQSVTTRNKNQLHRPIANLMFSEECILCRHQNFQESTIKSHKPYKQKGTI
jgi:hypothetical protein